MTLQNIYQTFCIVFFYIERLTIFPNLSEKYQTSAMKNVIRIFFEKLESFSKTLKYVSSEYSVENQLGCTDYKNSSDLRLIQRNRRQYERRGKLSEYFSDRDTRFRSSHTVLSFDAELRPVS